MKKISLFALCFLASAIFLAPGCAKKGSNELHMITEATFAPYEFRRGNDIVGIDVEIAKAVAAKLGKTLVVDDAKFDSIIPALKTGKADLAIAGLTVTEDRKANVDFSIPYVTDSGIVIISLKDKPYKSAEEAKGKKIGMQSGTTADTYCVDVLKQEPERYDSHASAVAALKAGKLDLVIADIDPAKNLVKGEDDIFISSDFLTKEEFAVAVRKDSKDLLATVNEVITELKTSGKMDEIVAQYKAEADKLKEAE